VRIAFQGEPGAYSEAAALRYTDHADLVPCESFDEVFTSVADGRASHGILPVENSIGGSIHRNYDLLIEHDLPIVGEVELPIRHHLLALPGTPFESLTRIYSHPQALAQCERFLREMSNVRVNATYDTAGSAKLIKEQQLHDAAAIASEHVLQVHEALDRIDRRHREVLVLLFLEGLSVNEIAAIVNIPEGTVKSRIHHAKKALREVLR
jgi:RNA polymerase sigma factor (sigma-70 family)